MSKRTKLEFPGTDGLMMAGLLALSDRSGVRDRRRSYGVHDLYACFRYRCDR